MYQRALEGYEKALGPDHTPALQTVGNLGNLYADQSKIKEAEDMYRRADDTYRRALEAMEGVLGKQHPDTLMI